MKPSTALDRHKAQLIELLRAHGVVRAEVFGSVASGEDVDGSDIDLLVAFAEERHGFAYYRRQWDLTAVVAGLLGVPCDVIDLREPGAERLTGPRIVLFYE